MIFITGDTHGSFERVEEFCNRLGTRKKDILIILGDSGINYYGGEKDIAIKEKLSNLPITLFCIRGNHDKNLEVIGSYSTMNFLGGKVYIELDYPNLIFAKDGEIYDILDKKAIVIGGAYSVDKYYRLQMGYNWFEDEQPSEKTKQYVESQLEKENWEIDLLFSHTCPIRYEPREWFLPYLDQSRVDKSTEKWLDIIFTKLKFEKWYCGHYHGDKEIDKIEFMFETIKELK